MEIAVSPLMRLRLQVAAALQRLSGTGIRYKGAYRSWKDASAASTGYGDAAILEKVAAAVRRVVAGEAAAERDSVTFGAVPHSFPVLAMLLRSALENDGRLTVLDFGGSLGSSYFQCRSFIPPSCKVSWHIVEQEHYVRRGRRDFASAELHFHASAAEAATDSRPDVVLASSVLQYLKHPYDTLRELTRCGSRYLIIDRTPLAAANEDRLTVQQVPPQIYAASYPCRIFSRGRLAAALQTDWQPLAEFGSEDGWAVAGLQCFRYGGMLLRRI